MVGWHHWLSGHEFEETLGDGDGQGSLACCSPRGHKKLDMTEQLNWTELFLEFKDAYLLGRLFPSSSWDCFQLNFLTWGAWQNSGGAVCKLGCLKKVSLYSPTCNWKLTLHSNVNVATNQNRWTGPQLCHQQKSRVFSYHIMAIANILKYPLYSALLQNYES